jgi:hypothetical protein
MPQLDLTWNLFTTPLFILILGIVIRRWFAINETAQATKDELATQRHEALAKKIDSYCVGNSKDHDYLWEKVNHHAHTPEGKVIDMTRG